MKDSSKITKVLVVFSIIQSLVLGSCIFYYHTKLNNLKQDMTRFISDADKQDAIKFCRKRMNELSHRGRLSHMFNRDLQYISQNKIIYLPDKRGHEEGEGIYFLQVIDYANLWRKHDISMRIRELESKNN